MASLVLMIPGPTNLSDDVRRELSEPMIGHTSPEFYEIFKDAHALTAKLFKSPPEGTVIISGSGTLGMEAGIATFLKPGDKVLSLITGYFGDRFAEIARTYGANVRTLRFTRKVDVQAVEDELKNGYDVVAATHIDTSTGILNDIKSIGEAAKAHGAFFFADLVSSLGCTEFDFSDGVYDYVYSASQKCIAGPPGAAMAAVSDSLLKSRADVVPRSYYMNVRAWLKVMSDPKVYLSTPSIPIIRALRVALREVFEEGIENKIKRHKELGDLAWRFVNEAGWRPLSESPSPSVIAFDLGREIARDVKEQMLKRGILIATGIGEVAPRVIRVGYMGWTTVELLYNTLRAIRDIAGLK